MPLSVQKKNNKLVLPLRWHNTIPGHYQNNQNNVAAVKKKGAKKAERNHRPDKERNCSSFNRNKDRCNAQTPRCGYDETNTKCSTRERKKSTKSIPRKRLSEEMKLFRADQRELLRTTVSPDKYKEKGTQQRLKPMYEQYDSLPPGAIAQLKARVSAKAEKSTRRAQKKSLPTARERSVELAKALVNDERDDVRCHIQKPRKKKSPGVVS
jgi:hypothetical protein